MEKILEVLQQEKDSYSKAVEKDTKMIYGTFFSYLQFIKSLSSHSDRVKIKALREELGVQHH